MSDKSSIQAALADAIRDLEQREIPYMLIGGLALSAWALPRATLDIDLTLWVPSESLASVCLQLSSHYLARVPAPIEFVQETRVLPVITEGGVRIDFLFAAFPFEKMMLDRAVRRDFMQTYAKVATLEDLIILKIASSRLKDREDVRSIVSTYTSQIDWAYLMDLVTSLSETLDRPEILESLKKMKAG